MRSGLHNIGEGFISGRAPSLHTIERGFVRGPDLGVAVYDANAVHFDGTNDWLGTGAGLTGAADSKLLSGSLWVKKGADGTSQRLINATTTVGGTSTRANVALQVTTNVVRLNFFNAAGTSILLVESSAVVVADGWVPILFSFDMADTGKRHLYISDASDLATVTTYTDDTIDFTLADWAIGARPDAGVKFTGDMAEVWFAPGVYIDFSVEANRRKFVSATGKPVNLGSDGSTPTGTAPLIFLSGATATWHTNLGTGGGFTENGAITDASSSPSD